MEIYKYFFDRGVGFSWKPNYSFPETFQDEVIAFLDQFPKKRQLQYLPKANKRDSSAIMFGLLFFYACCNLAKQPSGIALLRVHFSKKTVFSTLTFLIKFPKVDEQALREIVTSYTRELSRPLVHAVTTPSFHSDLGSILDILRSNSKIYFSEISVASLLLAVFIRICPLNQLFRLRSSPSCN